MDPAPPADSAPGSSPAPSSPAPSSPAPASPAPATAEHRSPPLPQLVTELRDLVVSYLKQQTLVPLQQLGRYVGFGLAGSLLLGFGVVFLAMSGLRALQEETGDTFSGDWSWVPYVIVIVALLLGGALVWLARGRAPIEEGGAQRMSPANENPKVTRADIEAKLQQIKHVTDTTTDTAADAGKGAMIGGAVLVVVLAYWFGRRRGHKKNTIVEIRRI